MNIFTLFFALDEAAPVIKADKEYPEWVFKLGVKVRYCHIIYVSVDYGMVCLQESTLGELVERAQTQGIDETTFTVQDAKRLKRLLTLDQIKSNNAESQKDSA